MFAKMKDGTIKPVQYHFIGAAINVGSKALPYVGSGLKYLSQGFKPGNLKNYFLPKGGALGVKVPIQGPIPKGGGGLGSVRNTATGIFSPSIKNTIGTTAGGGGLLYGGSSLFNFLNGDETEKETITEKEIIPGTEGGVAGTTIEETKEITKDKKITKDKAEPDANKIDKEIKKGTLDDLIKERIDIFEKYLGDGKDATRSGGFAALTEFGLNLASARGGNLMDKIARSAKDPLKTFTAIGMAAKDRADKIKMAGVEAGIKADEAQKERDAEAGEEGTTFQQNLKTLKAMFTNNDGELTINEEDLVNMAKSGATTSRKEFAAQIYASLGGTQNPSTLKQYSDAEIVDIINRGWAAISGQGAPESSPESQSTGTTVVEEESIDTILNKYK